MPTTTRRPQNSRFPSKVIDFGRIITALTNSKFQTENNALYQSIFQTVNGVQIVEERLNNKLEADATIPYTQISGLPIIKQGKYVPNFTAVANCDALGNFDTYWTQINDQVSVWGKITIDATAGSQAAPVYTEFEMSLPVRGRFQSAEQLSGTLIGMPFGGLDDRMIVANAYGSPISGNAVWQFYIPNAVDNDVRFRIDYLYIPIQQ